MFGSILLELRKENGISQFELAEKLGVSRSTIGMYEQGRREPDFETLEAIADIFNVDMDYLHGKSKVKRKINLDILREEHGYTLGKIAMSKDATDKEFMNVYSKLSPEQKEAILSVAKQMIKED